MKNVTLEDLRQPPYRATVEFDKVYVSAGTRTELKRETYVAHVVFVLAGPGRQCAHSDQSLGPDHYLLPRGSGVRQRGRARPLGPHAHEPDAVMPFIPRQVKPPARLAIACKVPEETWRPC